MKKIIIIVLSVIFTSSSVLIADVLPLKRKIVEAKNKYFNSITPIKKPDQPSLSQLLSNKDVQLFELALEKANEYKWERVEGIKQNINNETAKRTIDWIRYYNGASDLSFENYLQYIQNNSNWPEMNKININAESKINYNTDLAQIKRFFSNKEPETGWGNIFLGNAYLNDDNSEEGQKYITRGYVNGNFTRNEQARIIKNYKDILDQENHKKRIDKLLWEGKYRTASRLVKYVEKDYQKLFEARIGLISFAGGVDDLIRKVPKNLLNDPGLVHDRINWRLKKRKYDSALKLLIEINKTDPNKLVRPDKFWDKKNFLIRKLIDNHQYEQAYKLAVNHGLDSSKDIAEAEWLAGWISFVFLNNPESAYLHFSNIWNISTRPISKARASYWIAKSLESIGNFEDSQNWFRLSSNYSLTFYGQLSMSKLNEKTEFMPITTNSINVSNTTIVKNREIYLAISLLNEFDVSSYVKKFIWDLANRNDIETAIDSVRIANEIERHDFAVQAGKILYYNTTILHPLSFPTVEKPTFEKIIFPEQELINSLIRQESQFDPEAGSYAGAKGLMQLMPYTAKRISMGLNLKYTKSKLTENPAYNMILGSAYLDKLLNNYNGSYILSLAAYNAGESRVSRWIKKYGDPRKDDITSENWIELIPFKETRNYVQRVMENIQVYEFIYNDLRKTKLSLTDNLERAYVGGNSIIKPVRKIKNSL